jgi:hypothetical protein
MTATIFTATQRPAAIRTSVIAPAATVFAAKRGGVGE